MYEKARPHLKEMFKNLKLNKLRALKEHGASTSSIQISLEWFDMPEVRLQWAVFMD